MTTVTVSENALMYLSVGDFVAIVTHHMKDGKLHWTLGTVETPPYVRDVEVRLWEKQRYEYYDEDDTPANPETAELMARIAQVKQDLQASIDQAEALTQQLRERRAAIIKQIGEAETYVAESKAVCEAACEDVESISDRYWQELKSYRIPPKMVSVVIRAVMLLLSEDDARLWPQMQRVLRDFDFKRRITSYNPSHQLSTERRDYILQECVSKKSFRYDRAMQGSVAVGPIYYWVLAQLDSGEAQSQKDRVDQERVARQKELRLVLQQISEQQRRITEYQELMEDLDDQLRLCNQRNSNGSSVGVRSQSQSVSRSRRRIWSSDRYNESFAGREGKQYLRPAFYTWKPTDRVIIVLRKNIVCNFGAVTSQEQEEGYTMSEPQIRMLDAALISCQQALEMMSGGDEEREDEALEEDMFRQNNDEVGGTMRNDEEILHARRMSATAGKPTPMPTPQADGTDTFGMGAATATSKLERTFEGKNWHRVLDRKRDAIEAAFTEESAVCLEVPVYYISIDDLKLGSLIVCFSALHDGQRSDVELQGRVNAYGYPKVMLLYEEGEEYYEGPEHQVKFCGDRWVDLTPLHRDEIEAAFLEDTSVATGAQREEISVQSIRADEDEGLTVDYSMLDRNRDPEEVQEQVDAYAYPAMWDLYQRLTGLNEAGPIHQVRFRGERWADIIPGAEEAIKQAFAEDTANALGIAPRQVVPEEIRYEIGLTVPYTVFGCLLDGDEVDAKAEDYTYPKTWALYDRLVAEAVGAAYQKSFEGEHWEAVLHAARPEVSEAFCTDTANAVNSKISEVEPRSIDADQDRLLISYNVGNSRQGADTVRESTRAYPYPEVWAVYQLVTAEEAEGTQHLSQTFDGESWEAINARMPERVREAFTEDVAAATRVRLACVAIHDIKTSRKGMAVEYGMAREGGQSSYATRKAAKEFHYPAMWSLYEANRERSPVRVLGDSESGILQRCFEGDDWDIVLDACPEDLDDAFCTDAARVLGVPKANVRIISATLGSLIVTYQIVCPPCEDSEIQRRADEDEFPTVMGLYRRRVRGGDEGAALQRHAAPVLHNLEGMLPKVFDGDEWGCVLARQSAVLEQAFAEDTADALGVSVGQVLAKQLKASAYALQVQYSVRDCPSDGPAAQAAVEDYAYPLVWGLYQTEKDLGKYLKTFDGPAWKGLAASREGALKEAFVKDTADALKTDERSVFVKAVGAHAESLSVRYGLLDNRVYADEQVAEIQQKHAYPNMWVLYAAEERRRLVTTSHQVGFDGDDWVYVLRDKMTELQEAFVSCTADTFNVCTENVKNTKYTLGGLIVDFELTHPAWLTEKEIDERLIACSYERVWDLYGYHPWDPTKVTETSHEVCFDGPGWAAVLEFHRKELEECFQQDTATALEVQPSDVRIDGANYAKERLFMRATVTHHIFQDNELMQEQLRRYPYEAVWKLYAEDPNQGWATTSHQVGFDGDDWVYVLSARKKALEEAFRTCTSGSLGLTDAHITNVVLAANERALLATCEVQHPKRQSVEEVNSRLAECDYVLLWELYIDHPYNPDEQETTSHEIGFEGEEWNKVVETQPQQLEEAVMLDTAEALEVTPNDITSIKTSFEGGNLLLVHLDIRHPLLQDQELMKEQLGRYPYERVWALYEDAPITPLNKDQAGGFGNSGDSESGILQRCFEGDDWDIVLDACPEDLDDAFCTDAARVLGVPKANVRIISATLGSLIVTYQIVCPPCEDSEIQRRADEDEFPTVMGLYRRRVRGGDEGAALQRHAAPVLHNLKVTTLQDCGFEGEDWDYVWSIKQEAMCSAFAQGAADALGIDPADIENINMEKSEDGIVLGASVSHPLTQDYETIQKALKDHPFRELWALYETRPYDPNKFVSTEHVISFEGDEWGPVMAQKNEEVVGAIRKDTACALDVPEDDVTDVHTRVEPAGLIATIVVSHSPLQDNELTQEELAKYEYERVWALYCPEGVARRGTKHFDGLNWAKVMECDKEGVTQAFCKDTAAAMNARPEDVEVGDIRTTDDRMEVDYAVSHTSASEGDVWRTLHTYPYPNVWDYYRVEEEKVTTLQDCGFEGEDWDYVWSIKQEAMCSAFAQGAADALGIDPADIENINMEKSEDGIVLGASVSHPLTQDYETIQKALKDHPFRELWALYETRPYDPNKFVSTEHVISFEGDEWGPVMAQKNEEVVGAIRKDTACALDVPEDDVTDVHTRVEPAGLIATIVVSHSPLQDNELTQEELAKYEYERVWALYCPEGVARRGTKHFDGLNWAKVMECDKEGVTQAFCKDTAAAMNARPEDVEVGDIRTTDDRMEVDYAVSHTSASEGDVWRTLHTYPYPNVWDYYRVEEEKVTTLQDCGFEGEDWDYVWSIKQEAMCSAFAQGAADALGIDPADIENINMEKSEDGIVLGASVSHPLTQDYETIQKALKDHPFRELWALYETRPYDPNKFVSTEHVISFEGDEWGPVMAQKNEEVVGAIRKDTACALDVPEDDVTDVHTRVEPAGLIATIVVSHSPLQDNELTQEELAKYEYERVWALYCPEGVARRGTKHFDGLNWAKVMECDKEGVTQAFCKDTAAAMNARPEDVEVGDIRTTDDRMEVDYAVSHTSASEGDVWRTLHTYPYPNVWDYYRVEEEKVTTLQDCGFEGEDWDYVWSIKQEAMCSAFAQGAADALGIDPADIENINMEKSEDGIVLGASVSHPLTQDYETIQKALKDHPFRELWALYETRPYDPNKFVSTEHVISFEGDEWGPVMAQKNEEVVGAIRKDTACALDVPEDDVTDVHTRVEPAGLIATIVVSHSPLQDNELTQEELAKYEYERVWALYAADTHSGDEAEEEALRSRTMKGDEVIAVDVVDEDEVPEGYTRVALSVSFEGELWEGIVRRRTKEVADAFRAETAHCIGAAGEGIYIRECVVSAEGMLVHFSALCEETMAEEELRDRIDEHPYENVWALYEKEERVSAAMSKVMVKHFEGLYWDVAMKRCPELVEKSFKEDTADVLQVDAAKVLVEGTSLGSLIVYFRVQGLKISEAKATQLTQKYAYPKVWALYISRNEGGHHTSASNRTNGCTDGNGSRPSHRRAEQLVAEEGVESQETLTYLRKALAEARRERDMYMEQVEEVQRSSRHKK
ncbi:hypothetical protein LSCM1_04208 [Leishmania martiniquensis]|uniref:Flagellar attachment zone protein 1 conserved domain-containing protein n=1 Tax=Leishmania martiniquensis TaxID=1580590 RepID=A0A836KJG7_9TRYP|nr:hypothetical protein LSCM1_04208 [Leishmania martiniquensis]